MSSSSSPKARKTSDRISKLVSKFEQPKLGDDDIPLIPRASSSTSRLPAVRPRQETCSASDPTLPAKETRRVQVKKLAISREAPTPPDDALPAVQSTSKIVKPELPESVSQIVESKSFEPVHHPEEANDIASLPKVRLEGLQRTPNRPSFPSRTVSFASDNDTLVGSKSESYKKRLSSVGSDTIGSSSRRTSFDASQVIPKRPSLPASKSSGGISSATADIPAADLFSRQAKPLDLPALDSYLGSIPPFKFTETESVLSSEERKGWEKWLAGPEKSSWSWSFWRKGVKETEKEKQRAQLLNSRSAIFPPMHLIPPSLTVADLQQNKTAAAPLLGLDAALGTVIDGILGAQGSTYAIGLMNVELFRDMAQMLSLALTFFTRAPISPNSKASSVFSIFSTVTSALGLDFVSAFGKSILWFWIFLAIGAFAVWEFYQMTGGWRGKIEAEDLGEGFDREDAMNRTGSKTRNVTWRDSRAYKICIVFVATSLYVPLTKISLDALVWSSSFWPVPNPYKLEDFPVFDITNDPRYRNAQDFCYTTDMRTQDGLSNFNWAFIIVPTAATTILWLTIYFPIRLWQVIAKSVPKVDRYTEMGEERKDVDAEYERQLLLDKNALSFLYNIYRRKWAGFKAIYMAVKLANVLCVTIFTEENCIFRNSSRRKIDVIRQIVQLTMMAAFLGLQTVASPNLDRIMNNSDWISRTGYVLVSLIGLIAAIHIQSSAMLNGWVVLLVTGCVYAFNCYFAVVSFPFAQRWIKKIQKRLDFSIDVCSPSLDLAKHVARRVWQESFTTMLLTESRYKMPAKEKIEFASSEGAGAYLLGFRGSVGERHVENIKILREVGLTRYAEAISRETAQDSYEIRAVQRAILNHFTGPDCYWKPPQDQRDATSFYGRADVVPFPFAIVFRWDQIEGSYEIISEQQDLLLYLEQNQSVPVAEGRFVRLAIRAMDGQMINAPFLQMQQVGSKYPFFTKSRHAYSLHSPTSFKRARLCIERNSALLWNGRNMNSGFKVTLVYTDGCRQRQDGSTEFGCELELDGKAYGIEDDFSLTPVVARLLQYNKELVQSRMAPLKDTFSHHRKHYAAKAIQKRAVLSYDFLIKVYGEAALSPKGLAIQLSDNEQNENIQHMPDLYSAALTATQERLACVNSSKINQRWYLFFDDLWRRNRTTLSQLSDNPAAFSPHYRTSVCYLPMPRLQLEEFLTTYNLFSTEKRRSTFFHVGLLNSLYFMLDEIVFGGTAQAIPLHVGAHHHLVAFDQLAGYVEKQCDDVDDVDKCARPSVTLTYASANTGEGTSHDEEIIRSRSAFAFEQAYDPPRYKWRRGQRRDRTLQILSSAAEAVKTWLGLTPVVHSKSTPGVWMRMRVSRDGHYTLSSSAGKRALQNECL